MTTHNKNAPSTRATTVAKVQQPEIIPITDAGPPTLVERTRIAILLLNVKTRLNSKYFKLKRSYNLRQVTDMYEANDPKLKDISLNNSE